MSLANTTIRDYTEQFNKLQNNIAAITPLFIVENMKGGATS